MTRFAQKLRFEIKRGDLVPSLEFQLSPATVDLTGATVVFNMATEDGLLAIDRSAALVVTATGSPVVRYDWQAGDTDVTGTYRAEFEVMFADDLPGTFPNTDFIEIIVHPDLG